jgi:hypothetical protein
MRKYVFDNHCCAAVVERELVPFWEALWHPVHQDAVVDLGVAEDPFNLNASRASDRLKQSIHVALRPDNCSTATDMQVGCAMRSHCAYDAWPEMCCRDTICANGDRPYASACHCICHPGFHGRYCDKQGVFMTASMVLPGQTFLTFDLKKLHALKTALADLLSIDIGAIEHEEPRYFTNLRRASLTSSRALLESGGLLINLRVVLGTFTQLAQKRQPAGDLVCGGGLSKLLGVSVEPNFNCSLGPEVFFEGSKVETLADKKTKVQVEIVEKEKVVEVHPYSTSN